MNWLSLIAGVLTLLAFLAHAIMGGREFAHIAPVDASEKAAEVRLQVINGWHWVSTDLLLAGLGFILIAATDLIPNERAILLGLSGYFLIIAVVWLATTMITSRVRPLVIVRLGQWILSLVLSALSYSAA